MPSPAPVGPVIRPAVIDHWRRRIVVDRSLYDLRPFDHVRALPVGRAWRRGTLLRHTSAQVECGLDRETFLVLPADLSPAAVASAAIDQSAAGTLSDNLTPGARRRAQVDGSRDICRLRKN